LKEEFQPMKMSGSGSFEFDNVLFADYGISLGHGMPDDYSDLDAAGNAVLVKRYAPDALDSVPDTTYDGHRSITDKIINAISHEAEAVFLYTPTGHDDTIMFMTGGHITPKEIPIVWLRRKAFEKLGIDLENPSIASISGETELFPVHDTGYNVVGMLPGQTDSVIIIGAHYDHLGWGSEGSRYTGEEKKIHYGADDNASGTAALVELARSFADQPTPPRHSVVFIAFSGEEHGLLGSSHYARNMTVDSSRVRMMVNMDMIGRLREQDKGLAVFGTGTCEEFKAYFDSLLADSMAPGAIKLSSKESGTGPSDHTAFYNSDIPVIFFFTGAHEDYHSPADTPDKIDGPGLTRVTNFIASVVSHFDTLVAPLEFQRTKSDMPRRSAHFSVTLGIMPDYVSEVKGLRIDGVSPDRPADRAGLLKGDIIVRMGDYPVDDIYSYMSALGKFRKGDTTTVVVKRGDEQLSVAVDFN
jgi:hypothetical protein